MARLFELPDSRLAWATERDEDLVVIHQYLMVQNKIPKFDPWKNSFDLHFFQQGLALTQDDLDRLNSYWKRAGIAQIRLTETHVGEYARERDKVWRSEQRRSMRDELQHGPSEMRSQLVREAWERIAEFPPPHHPYHEYKAIQAARRQKELENLTDLEVSRRAEAARRALKNLNVPVPDGPEPAPVIEVPKTPINNLTGQAAILMLRASAAKPDLAAKVVARIPAEECIALLEHDLPPEVQTLLVEAALG